MKANERNKKGGGEEEREKENKKKCKEGKRGKCEKRV